MLTLAAPAKVNLTLEVLSLRADGYHEIRSVLQSISLYNRITFEPAAAISLLCDAPGWQAEKSLAFRAAHRLKELSGCSGGAGMNLVQGIPLSSGLGGDSSSGAAVLKGLNRLWNLKIPRSDLAHIAAELSSDMPFFFSGGTALVQGRGEICTPLPPPHGMWLVLLHPPLPRPAGKTAALYQNITPALYSQGDSTAEIVRLLKQGQSIDSAHLFNVFDKPAYAFFKGLAGFREMLLAAGAPAVHVAGSGPTLFSIFDTAAGATRVYKHLQSQGITTYLAHNTSIPLRIYERRTTC